MKKTTLAVLATVSALTLLHSPTAKSFDLIPSMGSVIFSGGLALFDNMDDEEKNEVIMCHLWALDIRLAESTKQDPLFLPKTFNSKRLSSRCDKIIFEMKKDLRRRR